MGKTGGEFGLCGLVGQGERGFGVSDGVRAGPIHWPD